MKHVDFEGLALPVDFHCSTNGRGHWSAHATAVRVTRLLISHVETPDDEDLEGRDPENWDPRYGELQVEFDIMSWNPAEHGLIYTDPLFKYELQGALTRLGFSSEAILGVGYSEQGMQGDDYVSFDVNGPFIAEAAKLFKLGEWAKVVS